MSHADTPAEIAEAYEDLFAEFVATYEDRRREELFAIARAMTSIGMAGGGDLRSTVYPFILRGVNLLGINSVRVDRPTRLAAWQRLARDLPADVVESMTSMVALTELRDVAGELLAGRGRGRTVVELAHVPCR